MSSLRFSPGRVAAGLLALPLFAMSASAFAAGAKQSHTPPPPVGQVAHDLSQLGIARAEIPTIAAEAAALAGRTSWLTPARRTALNTITTALGTGQEWLFAKGLRDLGIPLSMLPHATRTLNRVAFGTGTGDQAARIAIHEGLALLASGKTHEAQVLGEAFLKTPIGHAVFALWLGKPAPAPQSRSFVLGYYVPGTSAYNDLVRHASQITAIAPLWYSFAPSDRLNTLASGTASLTVWAHAHGVAVYPIVINGYGNDNMLRSQSLMQQDVNQLVQLAKTANYDGFNIDFESLNNPDEAGLNQFVQELAAGLHQEGKKLIVSVGPRTSSANGYHVYNYVSLGQSADYVDLMTYDAHDNGGPSGPVAPLSWVDSIVNYAAQTIPHQKILVGLAGYGYNWAADGSTEINDQQAAALANRYGQTWVGGSIGEWEIHYVDGSGYRHTVWYENSSSEQAKAALVKQDGLGGVALWDLGEENVGVWPMLAKTLP